MRKAVVIIAAVAILGFLGLLDKAKKSPTSMASPSMVNASTSSTGTTSSASSQPVTYNDGTYTGNVAPTNYGNVQIELTVSGGKITDVKYLQMPNDQPESREHTADSEPLLKQQVLAKQSANISFVTGATDTSFGFEQSLQAALNQAAS